MMSRTLRVFSILISFSILAPFARAQWHADSTTNTPVCVTGGQQDMPRGCTDGADGAIFAWEDARTSTYQIYAQHLDASGRTTWASNGVKLASLTRGIYPQNAPIIASDDSGGAYIVWSDGRYASTNGTCLYAQHIRADGSLAYPDSGFAVAIGLNGCANPVICDDGRGCAYIAWEDNRSATVSTRPDIWMNRLWPGGVKFGLTAAGNGAVISRNIGTWGHPKYVNYFDDSGAHFKPYMVNLPINIVGKGSFLIATVLSDTQMTLKSYPPVGNYAYSVGGLTGLPLDTFQNKQSGPSIVNDGLGGCYIAWTSSASATNSIYATRVDTTGTALWDPEPGPGYLIYQNQNPSNPSKNVWINRDGNELLLAWEVTNSENQSQEVYAQKMRNSSLYDTAFEWGNTAVDVTSDQILDQTAPRIYGDDSTVLGTHGVMVPFLDAEPGSPDDIDIAMVRVFGDGGSLAPPAGNGFYFLEQKPHTQSGMRTVKITDDSDGGTRTGILAVWNDAWDGQDTMVYAQRMDRNGRKYFPTVGTTSHWGLAISGDSAPTRRWSAKQVCLVPRDNGGIAAWTDFRNGNADIYAQLILNDGTANIPVDLTPPVDSVLARSGSFDGSICNTRCTNVLASDSGALASGIKSVAAGTISNMNVTVSSFQPGAKQVPFSVCVVDSMLNGSAAVAVTDEDGNKKMELFSYCTIPDTNPPTVSWNITSGANWVSLSFNETRPWDRGLGSLIVSDTSNVTFSRPLSSLKPGVKTFDIIASPVNPALASSFAIQASDTDGNLSAVYPFTRNTEGVVTSPGESISLSISPNPSNGVSVFTLFGAPAADISIYDVLGRELDHFRVVGSTEWNPSSLAPGTYYVRANIGGLIVNKTIVRQ